MRSWIATVTTLVPGGSGPMHMEFKFFRALHAIEAATRAHDMALAVLKTGPLNDDKLTADCILVTSLTDNGPAR